jgi:hypothetical protein
VGPRTGLDDVERREILALAGLELRSLGRQAVASRYNDGAVNGVEGKIVSIINGHQEERTRKEHT